MSSETPTLVSLQTAAGLDTGTVIGTVAIQQTAQGTPSCVAATPCIPITDAQVQLGIWHGSASAFRDSGLTMDQRVALGDPRFEVVATARSDSTGQVRFAGLPKKQSFVIRALAPQAAGGGVAYFPSQFWLYESDDMTLPLIVRNASR